MSENNQAVDAHPDTPPPSVDVPKGISGEIERLSRKATAGFLSAERSAPEEGADCIWIKNGAGQVLGEFYGPQSSRFRVANAELLAALWNAYRSGHLVLSPTPPDLIQAAREAAESAALDIVDWMMTEGLARHRTPENDALRIEDMILRALQTTTQGEEGSRGDVPEGWVLVPREPTAKMRQAASAAMSPGKRPTDEWLSNGEKHAVRYRAMLSAAPTPDANSGGEAPGKVVAWLERQIEATHRDADSHPEGSGNHSFYLGQAIAYENALSLVEDAAPHPSQETGA